MFHNVIFVVALYFQMLSKVLCCWKHKNYCHLT